MNTTLFERLTADMNAGVKRLYAKPGLLNELTKSEVKQLHDRVNAYSPKTEAGSHSKAEVMSIIEDVLAGKDIQIHKKVSDSVAQKIAESTFVLEIHSRQPTFTKKVDGHEFMGIVDKEQKSGISADRLVVSKRLIDRKELKALSKLWGTFIQGIRSMALPGGLLTLGNGQMLIPIEFLPEVRERISEYLAGREELIGELGERYPQIVEDAKEKLKDLFKPEEYPPFDVLRQSYTTDYKYISNSVPENFEKISKEIYEQERARILAECATAGGLIHDTLRTRFVDYVEHITNVMGVDEETGKPKRFKETTITNLQNFVENFRTLNLTGDGDLEALVNQAKGLLDGTTAKDIRSDEEVRARIEEGFAKLKEKTRAFAVPKARKVILD